MFDILNLASIGIRLSRKRTTKALIRLREYAGSAPLLFAYGINRFSHFVVQLYLLGMLRMQGVLMKALMNVILVTVTTL